MHAVVIGNREVLSAVDDVVLVGTVVVAVASVGAVVNGLREFSVRCFLLKLKDRTG